MEHRKLDTIQKQENLNEIYRIGFPGPGGAHHMYWIVPVGGTMPIGVIKYQLGRAQPKIVKVVY